MSDTSPCPDVSIEGTGRLDGTTRETSNLGQFGAALTISRVSVNGVGIDLIYLFY